MGTLYLHTIMGGRMIDTWFEIAYVGWHKAFITGHLNGKDFEEVQLDEDTILKIADYNTEAEMARQKFLKEIYESTVQNI